MSLLQDDNKVRIKYKDGMEVEMPNEGLKALVKKLQKLLNEC